MPEALTGAQITYFVLLLIAFALLVTERLRGDVVGVLIVVALAVTRLLEPEEALAGFSSESAVTMAAVLVLGAGVHQTGLSDLVGVWIGRLAAGGLTRALAVMMTLVGALSAFTHHVTTTAMMLPVTLDLSRRREIPPSRLLMPLSFAASLGTTITILGVPAFLIASDQLRQAGRPGLGVFEIAPIGLALTAAGTLLMVVAGRFLLPARQAREDAGSHFRLDRYFTELTILPDSPFAGETIQQVQANDRYRLRVVGWVRGGRRRTPPFPGQPLEPGDVLLVTTPPDDLVAIRQERGVELHPVAQYGAPGESGSGEDVADRLVQAVVAPGADLAGRTLRDVDFHRRYGAVVVGLWRRGGWLDRELAEIHLRPGDVLVLQGDDEALGRVGADPSFLMMIPFHGETRLRRKAPVAGIIMAASVAVAAVGWLSLEIAMLAGAAAMVLSGCLTVGQAYRAIDTRIYVFIAGAIPLGAAMEKSGASQVVAAWLGGTVQGWSRLLILLALFWITALVTQVMSDAATVAILGPVAVALARGLGEVPEPYVVTVAMAAVASFLTPIGHHGNLLIYGPGGYRFWDFVRVGAPLTLVVSLIVAVMAPWLWPG